MWQDNCKFYVHMKRPGIAKALLKSNSKMKGLPQPRTEAYYKAIREYNYDTEKAVNQWNRIKISKGDPGIFGHLLKKWHYGAVQERKVFAINRLGQLITI